jgi:death-on-curing protein
VLSGGDEPIYLTLVDVLQLYAELVEGTLADARDDLRDPALLEIALDHARAHTTYENADLVTAAAVLAHGVAEGDAFVQGNMRIALVVMLTFLEANGLGVRAADGELADWIVDHASGASARLANRLRVRTYSIG